MIPKNLDSNKTWTSLEILYSVDVLGNNELCDNSSCDGIDCSVCFFNLLNTDEFNERVNSLRLECKLDRMGL